MITVAIFNVIVVFFAYLARNKGHEYFLKVSFLFIFLFLALRYDYGNDYQVYLQGFLEVNRYVSIDYFDKSWYYEPGWLFLYRLFNHVGFFALVAVLAAFNCFVYYRFIKKYVTPDYYWFAVFLYVFDCGLMLTHSSAMRQSLAIDLFLISIDYLNKKDAARYFLCIGLASLFHISALVLAPIFLLVILDWKVNKTKAIIFFAAYILLFIFGQLLIPLLNQLVSSNFDRYENYQGSSEIGTGLGLLLNSALLGLVLYYEPLQAKQKSLLFKIAFIGYLILPLSLGLSQLGRVGMYFQPAMIIVFPAILSSTKRSVFKMVVLVLIIFLTLYGFYGFFQSVIYKEAFNTYRTIFSSPTIY
jgi:hypothetical protein